MAGKLSPALPGVAAAFMMAALTWTEAAAFQTPIIFPLLWIAKRLTQDLTQDPRIGSRQIPIISSLKGFVGTKDGQKDDDAKMLVEWLNSFEGMSSSVKIDTNAQGLRGLYATRDIRKGEDLVEIPYEAALLVGDSLSPPMYDDFDFDGFADLEDVEDVHQGLGFLEYFLNNHDYAPYMNILPSKPSSGDQAGLTPDFWAADVISDIQIPSFADYVLQRKKLVEEVAEKNGINDNDLRWATWLLRSRRITTYNMVSDPNSEDDEKSLFGVFPSRRKQIEQMQGFLLPLIDMANHAHDPNAVLKITVNRWTREFDDTSKFALRALRPIKKGEEATILYGEGDRTSWDLLDKYGFFLEGNEADKQINWEELEPEFSCSLEEDEMELAMLEGRPRESNKRVLAKTKKKLKTIVAKIQPDYVPNFASKIGSDLHPHHLVGTGMRQKMGISIYAVAMYFSASLDASHFSSREELRNAAQSFDTSFVLEIIFQPDTANTIAEAISKSVELRYGGPPEDVKCLEDLIVKSQEIGKATKGSVLQFDCTAYGVYVSINGIEQGIAKYEGLGSAFVDVFLDVNTVSPSLVDDCLEMRKKDGATVSNMAIGRRAMLSFRILMKRLSNWTAAETVADVGIVEQQEELVAPELGSGLTVKSDAETVVNVGKINQQEEEVVSELYEGTPLSDDTFEVDAHEGVYLSEVASGVTDESDTELTDTDESGIRTVGDVGIIEQQEEPVVSELYEGTDLVERAPVVINESDAEKTKEADSFEAAADLFEAASGVLNESNAEMLISSPEIGDVATSEAATVEVDPNYSLYVEPGNGITMNDSARFDANTVESRIRELEAEIKAEIARVKPPQSVRTQATAIAVEPDQQYLSSTQIPPSNHVSAKDRKENDVPSPNTIKANLKLESKERQKQVDRASAEAQKKIGRVEDKMNSLKDKATGVTFAPKLEDGLYLVGVGVRKKTIIKVYAVALYSHISALEALSPFSQGKQEKEAQLQLRNAARTFDASSPTTSLVLEMVFKADAQTIACAIADQVKPRYIGPTSHVEELENLIIEGVKNKGGQATKGTVFRFDCTAEGVKVSIDGEEQGIASFDGMGSAFVDVFLDEQAVSSTLVDSCLSTWCESGLP